MERIKTAVILPYFGAGGAEKMVSQFVAGIDQSKIHAEVFCVYGEPLGNHMEQDLHDKGIVIHYIRKKLGFSPSAVLRLFRELDRFAPDVIHTHLNACVYAALWPIIRRKPFLHTFHLPPTLENNSFLRRTISKLLIGMRVMSPVAISHQNQTFISEYFHLPKDKIPVVYNPVELSKFEGLKPGEKTDFTFITAGRLSAQKNQKLMLRAFAAFLEKGYEAKLVILGKGEEEESLRMLAKELKISNFVDFAGFVVNVQEYLINADVFLLSSDYEALPLALLEAMAAGLPIVSTDVGGVRDIVTDNGVLISSGDMNGMVQAMEDLYLNKDVRDALAAASKNNARRYDVSNTSAGYSELYRQFAGKK